MPGRAGDGSGDTLTDRAELTDSAGQLSVMSFNVRYDDAHSDPTGPDHWAGRTRAMAELLSVEQPHLIGTQEPLFHQLATIDGALPEHRRVGYGRAGGSRGEFNAVFYDTRRLILTGWDQRWLSETPDLIGSYDWGAALPRIVVRCDFVDRATGVAFTFINAHLDHASEEARVKGAGMLAGQATATQTPTVLTGDFNAPAETAPAWHRLVDAGYRDSWLEDAGRGDTVPTYHGYGRGGDSDGRIDWILVRGPVRVASARINTFRLDGHWPSDHYPVQARLRLG